MPRLSELEGEASVSSGAVDIPIERQDPDEGFAQSLLGEGFAGSIPQTAGSLLSMAKTATPAGMVVSGVGGAGGEAFKQIGQHYTGSELAPQSAGEAAKRIGMAFVEEAALEGVGRGIASGFSKIASKVRPKMKEGFDQYERSFSKYGGKLSVPQRIEHKNLASWTLLTLDGLARGSITAKGIYKNFDVANNQALKNMGEALIEEISDTATKNLSDHNVGRIFMEAVDSGKAAHSAASGVNYQAVDNISKKFGVTVNTGKLKTAAAQWREKFNKIGNVGRGDIATTEIDNVLKVGKELSFEDAHFLRSALLNKSRELELKGETGVSKKILGDLVEATNKIMDDAGSNTGIQEAYKKASKFYKFGAKSFNDKFMVKLLQKDPERIGETIFRAGNVGPVIQAKQALKKASIFNNSIDYNSTWKAIQEGYMAGVLSGPLVDDAGTPIGKRILKMFDDRKKLRTMKTAFNESQLNNLKRFGKIAEAVQAKPEAGLSMAMQLSQIGAGLALLGGVMEETAIPIFLGPPVVAKLLTNPKRAALLTKLISTPVGNPRATTLLTKLTQDLTESEMRQIESDSESFANGVDPYAQDSQDPEEVPKETEEP